MAEEIDRSPRERTTPPLVLEKPVPVLSVEQLRALLELRKGRELLPLRDTAIIRLLMDTGGRLGEVAGLRIDDLDFDADVAHVIGKGRRPRALQFGDKTGTALIRYLRARAKDKAADRPELWLRRYQPTSPTNAETAHQFLNAARRPESHPGGSESPSHPERFSA